MNYLDRVEQIKSSNMSADRLIRIKSEIDEDLHAGDLDCDTYADLSDRINFALRCSDA